MASEGADVERNDEKVDEKVDEEKAVAAARPPVRWAARACGSTAGSGP